MSITKASDLTILLPFYDVAGIMRFPSSGGPYFGIHCVVDLTLAVSKQATKSLESYFGIGGLIDKVETVAAIEPVLREAGKTPSMLYLMKVKESFMGADPSWFTIAQVLRSMPSGPNRVAYMKALQFMAGAADAEVSVLEVDEIVKQRLKDLASESPTTLIE